MLTSLGADLLRGVFDLASDSFSSIKSSSTVSEVSIAVSSSPSCSLSLDCRYNFFCNFLNTSTSHSILKYEATPNYHGRASTWKHSNMGRVKDLKELRKRGPGRKARKQPDPEAPVPLNDKTSGRVEKRTGGRIMQRARKRAAKAAVQRVLKERTSSKPPRSEKKESPTKGAETMEFLPEDLVDDVSGNQPFSDDNQLWLQMVSDDKATSEENSKTTSKDKVPKSNLLGSDGDSDGKYFMYDRMEL